jgi:hypothetical protein
MNAHLTGLISLGLAAAFVAGPAYATPPTLYQITDGVGFTNGDLIGSINYIGNPPNYPPVTFNGNVYIGPLNMQVTNESTKVAIQQTVYCTDIFDDYISGGLYTVSPTNLTGQLTAELGSATDAGIKIKQINALLSHASPTNQPAGAAIQAAIWEIENEPGVTGYSLATGKFTASVDSGNQPAFAADAATDLANVTGTTGDNGIWQPTSGETLEEFVVAEGQGANQSFSFLALPSSSFDVPAPEPASLSVLGLGVLGLAAIRRRRPSKHPA